MATLQVKHLDDELHSELKHRAEQEGTTLSELVTRMIRRELARPSMSMWLDEVRRLPTHSPVDAAGLIEEGRTELDRG